MARVLIAGAGYVGAELAKRLRCAGHEVVALRHRSLPIPGVRTLSTDLTRRHWLAPVIGSDFSHIVYCVSAKRRDPKHYHDAYVRGLRNLLSLEHRRLERVIFVSSTAVYGQHEGEWVDECSPTIPSSFSGQMMLEAEKIANASSGGMSVRFSGIYGPGRERRLRLLRTGLKVASVDRYLNMVHRDDCVGILEHLLFLKTDTQVFLGSDPSPLTEYELNRALAHRLNVSVPRPSPSQNGRNKRCDSSLLQSTGYEFCFANAYRGYSSMIDNI